MIRRILIVTTVGVSLAGCTTLERTYTHVSDAAARTAAASAAEECRRGKNVRMTFMEKVQRFLRELHPTARVTALDCDGEDGPDF